MQSFFSQAATGRRVVTSFNEDLRKYMLGIYNFMSLALGISALVAFVALKTGITLAIMRSPVGILVSFAPFFLVMYMSFKLQSMDFAKARNLFIGFAALMGLSLSSLALMFSGAEITRAFFATAGMFGGMSLYGYKTGKDLSSMASTVIMVVWGLIIASFINIFLHSSAMQFFISFVSVIAFALLTAYDTQKLKNAYYQMSGRYSESEIAKMSLFGALQLYMDFINIFVNLLYLLRATRD